MRKMIAADIGCVEYSCQHGKGDPPMDCIWPDCPCGVLWVTHENTELLAARVA